MLSDLGKNLHKHCLHAHTFFHLCLLLNYQFKKTLNPQCLLRYFNTQGLHSPTEANPESSLLRICVNNLNKLKLIIRICLRSMTIYGIFIQNIWHEVRLILAKNLYYLNLCGSQFFRQTMSFHSQGHEDVYEFLCLKI